MSDAPCSQRRSSASCSPRSVPRRRLEYSRFGPAGAGRTAAPQSNTGDRRRAARGPAIEVGRRGLRIGGYLGVTGIYRSTNIGRDRHELRLDPVRGYGPGECERNAAQFAILTPLPSCGMPIFPTRDTFSQVVGVFRNGLRWRDAWRGGGHQTSVGFASAASSLQVARRVPWRRPAPSCSSPRLAITCREQTFRVSD